MARYKKDTRELFGRTKLWNPKKFSQNVEHPPPEEWKWTHVEAVTYATVDNQTYFPTRQTGRGCARPCRSCEQLCGVEGGPLMWWAGAWSRVEALCTQECGDGAEHSSPASSTRRVSAQRKPEASSSYGELGFHFIGNVLIEHLNSPTSNAVYLYSPDGMSTVVLSYQLCDWKCTVRILTIESMTASTVWFSQHFF